MKHLFFYATLLLSTTVLAQFQDRFLSGSQTPEGNFHEIKIKAEAYFSSTLDTTENEDEAEEAFERWEKFWSTRVDAPNSGDGSFRHALNALYSIMNSPVCASNTYSNWSNIGPGITPLADQALGIVTAVEFDPVSPTTTFYVGTPTSGLWRTTDGGSSWLCLTESLRLPGLGIQDIAIDPTNNNIIYIATGISRMGSYGVGVMKSTDGGLNWNTTGLSFDPTAGQFVVTHKILIDPTNTNNLFALTDSKIYKTTNAGTTWTTILTLATSTHFPLGSPCNDPYSCSINTRRFVDIDMKPGDPNTLYASTDDESNAAINCVDYCGAPFTTATSNGGAELWKTIDGGTTWTELTPVSSGTSSLYISNPNIIKADRIGIAVTPAEPNSIFLIYGHANNAINGYFHKSTDGGVTWQSPLSITTSNVSYYNFMPSVGYWGSEFEISPTNPNVIYTGSLELFKSSNAGMNWTQITDYWPDAHINGGHADIRAVTIRDNAGNDVLLVGNDGGAGHSTNSGSTWSNVTQTLPTNEFFGLAGTEANPNLIVAGAQDNGGWTYNSGNWAYNVQGFGDAYEFEIDYKVPPNCYGEGNGSTLKKSINGNNSWFSITNPPGTTKLFSPLYAHPTNNFIYSGRHDVYKSSTTSISWTQISNFSQTNFPGVSTGGLTAVAVSQSNPNVIYAAYSSTCGSGCSPTPINGIFRTTSGGGLTASSWVDITANFPISNIFRWLQLTSIEVNPVNEAELWVTVGGFSNGERVWHSNDYGNTWSDYSNGLTQFPANKIVCANGSTGDLYLATDVGVFYTNNAIYPTQGWTCFSNNLPVVIATDLEVNKCAGIIRVSTFGRGIWESPLAPSSTTISVTASQNPICINQTATLTVNLPDPASTYNWYDASTGGTLLGTGTSFTTPILTATTTFYVEEISTFCTSPRTALVVNYTPIPAADLYIKDTQTPTNDDGTEPNPNNFWEIVDGVDVWIRNSSQTQTSTNPPHYTNEHIHESAEWSSSWATNNATLPRIYVKVRNKGCSTVTGKVHLYYHKFSTSDAWGPCTNGLCGSWQEIFCDDTNGNDVIDGSETNSCTSNVITLAPGEDGVIEQIWYPAKNFLDPTISGNRDEYCLLARLVCDAGVDQITTEATGISAAWNAKNSNNIVQKNVMFVNNQPNLICYNLNIGNYTMLRTTNKLDFIDDSSSPFTGSQGQITLDLGKELYEAWVRGGKKGTGIADNREKYNHMSPNGVLHNHSHLGLDPKPYAIKLTGGSATLENIDLAPQEMKVICTKFNYYAGPAIAEPFRYSVSQSESSSNGQPNYNYTGAVNYYITKPACSAVNAGPDKTIGRICSTQLTASPLVAGATYIWRDDATGDSIGSGTSIVVSPHNTTTYEVEMSTPDNCISYDVITVNVDANTIPCGCPGPTFDKVVLQEDKTIYNENIVIKDKLTVQAGATLRIKDSQVLLMKDAIIEVVPGGRLEIINSDLRSCNSLEHWRKIRIIGNGNDEEQLKISGSVISDAITSIVMDFVRKPKIIGNTINGGDIAIEMGNSQDIIITDNIFNANEVAIKSVQTKTGTGSLIEQNTFLSNKTALLFNNDNHSKLSINCNNFNNYSDYAIYSNRSILKNQGEANMGAGNIFVSSSTKLNNKLYHNGDAMNYYYDPSLPLNLNTNNTLTAMALPSQQDNSCQVNARVANPKQYSNKLENNMGMEYSELINSIPNPAYDKATITYKLKGDISDAEIRVTTLLGEFVAKHPITKDSNSLDINCSGIANGIYFYSLIINGNTISTKKMIITK